MSDNNTCKTCKWWKRLESYPKANHIGNCLASSKAETSHKDWGKGKPPAIDAGRAAAFDTEFGDTIPITTHADYGCIHYKAKP